MSKPVVVLWDIDGTLVRGSGGRISLNAFLDAIQFASNLAERLPYPHDSGGKTDQQIALEVLVAASFAPDTAAALLPAFSQAYFSRLDADRAKLTADLLVLPGVRAVLSQLQDLGVGQTVLTGNLEPIAQLKLACAGLAEYIAFEVGAYGSDHADRTRLVPIVRERLVRQHGPAMAAADLVVVGDTPRDIACARAGGARVIAVATGNASRAELEAHHPDALFDDLSDTAAVVASLLGGGTAVQYLFEARPHRLEA